MADNYVEATAGKHQYTRSQDRLVVVLCHGKKIGFLDDPPELAEDDRSSCPNCGWRMTAKRFGGNLKLLGMSR